MSRAKRMIPALVCAVLAIGITLAATTTQAQVRLANAPAIELTGPASELQLPDEPARHYAWPIAMMTVSTVGVGSLAAFMASGGFCFSPSCDDLGVDARTAVPYALGGVVFTVALSWLIARVVRFRRAHRAFEEGTPRLAW